jgi:hypothetical protein
MPFVRRCAEKKTMPDDKTLLDEAAEASEMTARERARARDAAQEAAKRLEAALTEALDGEPLRGMRNLGSGNAPLYGARLRGDPDAKLAWPNEPDEVAESLVLLPSGALAVAQCVTDEHGRTLDAEVRDPFEIDIRAEDAEAFVRTLSVVLRRHIEASKKAQARYARTQKLADQVRRILVSTARKEG